MDKDDLINSNNESEKVLDYLVENMLNSVNSAKSKSVEEIREAALYSLEVALRARRVFRENIS